MPPKNTDPQHPSRWQVRLIPSAVRQLQKMDGTQRNHIRAALTKIADLDDPTTLGKRLVADDNIWRYRAGKYRILCELNHQELIVLVVKIGHRRDVYRTTR